MGKSGVSPALFRNGVGTLADRPGPEPECLPGTPRRLQRARHLSSKEGSVMTSFNIHPAVHAAEISVFQTIQLILSGLTEARR